MLIKARFRLPEIVFGILFAVAVFAVGMVFAGSYHPPSQQNAYRSASAKDHTNTALPDEATSIQSQASPANSQRGEHEKGMVETFFEIKLTDVLLVLFTAVLAWRTTGLFVETAGLREAADKQRLDSLRSIEATEKSAKAAEEATVAAVAATNEARQANTIAKEANILQVRPWVIMEIGLADKIFLQPNGRAQFPVRVTPRNIGKIPAEDLHILVQSRRYQEAGETLADFVKLNTREGADFRKMILLPGEGEPQLWPQVPVYDPPATAEAFKVTLFQFYVGAFYKTPMMEGYRVTATSYTAAIRVNEGNALAPNSAVVGFSRDGGIVT